jgi:hypothetical protein
MSSRLWPTRGFLLAAAGRQPSILRPQVGAPGPRDGLGGLDERRFEPLVARTGPPALLLAGTLVIAGTHAGPRRQVCCCGKAGHVRSNLRHQCFRRASREARDTIQSRNGCFDSVHALRDFGAYALDRIVQRVDVEELLGQEKALMWSDLSTQRPFECCPFLTQLPLGQVGKLRCVRVAGYQPLQHRSPGHAQHIAGHDPYFFRAMGTRRSFEHLQASYPLGTTSEIVQRLEALAEAGCTSTAARRGLCPSSLPRREPVHTR